MDVVTLALAKSYVDRNGASTWHHGETLPDSELGNDGDYYLHTVSGDIYKKDGEWSLIANLQGPPGEDGGFGNYDGGHPGSVYASLRVDGGGV